MKKQCNKCRYEPHCKHKADDDPICGYVPPLGFLWFLRNSIGYAWDRKKRGYTFYSGISIMWTASRESP